MKQIRAIHYGGHTGDCKRCPLAIVRGGVQCDIDRPGEVGSPYYSFTGEGNPRPMLKWLRRARKFENAKKKKGKAKGGK